MANSWNWTKKGDEHMSTTSSLTAEQKARLEILQQSVLDCQKVGLNFYPVEVTSATIPTVAILLPRFKISDVGSFEKMPDE